MKRPLALFCGVFVLTSLICSIVGIKTAGTLCLPVALLCAALSLPAHKNRNRLLLSSVSVLSAFIVFAVGVILVYSPAQRLANGLHSYYACVTDDSTATVLKADGKRVMPFGIKIYSDKLPKTGEYVRITGKAYEIERGSGLYTYGLYDHAKGIYLSMNDPDIEAAGRSSYLIGSSYRIRKAVEDRLSSVLDENTAGKLRGILLGDKSDIALSDRNMYSAVGIAHIFAVSGLHITIVLSLILLSIRLFKPERHIAAALIIAATLFLMYVIGFTPSVTRAGIMAVILALSHSHERRADTLTSLMLSGAIICVLSPFAAADCSFLLSFCAVLGLILLSGYFKNFFARCFELIGVKSRFCAGIAGSLGVSFSVMIFTMPVVVVCFGASTLLAPIGNLLVVWALPLLLSASLLLLIIPIRPIAWFVTAIIKYIDLVVRLILKADRSGYIVTESVMFILVVAAIILFILCLKSGRAMYNRAILSFLIMLTATAVAGAVLSKSDDMIYNVLDVGEGSCSVIVKDKRAVVINCGSSTVGEVSCVYALADCLNDYGIYEIDSLIITDAKESSCSALGYLSNSYDIGTLYVADASVTDMSSAVLLTQGETRLFMDGVDICVKVRNGASAVSAVYGGSKVTALRGINKASWSGFADIGSTDVIVLSSNDEAIGVDYDMLKSLSPKAAVVSCGEELPSEKALAQLKSICKYVYTTQRYDRIEILTNGNEFKIRTEV